MFGCVCDSSWSVGLGAGDTQEPEWFGPDCSYRKYQPTSPSSHLTSSHLRAWVLLYLIVCGYCLLIVALLIDADPGHCPSADNPRTAKVETDCEGVTAKNSLYRGAAGNLCQVLRSVYCAYCMYFVYCAYCMYCVYSVVVITGVILLYLSHYAHLRGGGVAVQLVPVL